MFSVNNVNVDEGEDFERPGWTPGSFPAYQHEGKRVSVNGWTRGPFGIFSRQFDDFDAGRTSAVPLIHLRSGKRIAVFAELEGAAIAAERAEPLADWNTMIAEATFQDDIDERIYKTLPNEWLRGYTFSQLYCPDGGVVHYRLTPSMQQAHDRMMARIAERERELSAGCADAPPTS
jgi:hypothetical protein